MSSTAVTVFLNTCRTSLLYWHSKKWKKEKNERKRKERKKLRKELERVFDRVPKKMDIF